MMRRILLSLCVVVGMWTAPVFAQLSGGGVGGGVGGGDGAISTILLASGITTNTTTAAVAGVAGNKTFWMEIVGTGAVSVDIAIYGARVSNPTANELVLLCTKTGMASTDKKVDACATSTAPYPYYVVQTTNISGTSASVSVYVFH